MVIKAMRNGKVVGYIEAVNEVTNTFSITKDKEIAEKYDTEDEVQGEIDILTRINSNYIYLYE